MIVIGLYKFGRLPIYGDPDPSCLSIDWLDGIALAPAFLCFFTIPATIFLTLDLIIFGNKLISQEKTSLLISFVCIAIFICTKHFLPETFNWVMD